MRVCSRGWVCAGLMLRPDKRARKRDVEASSQALTLKKQRHEEQVRVCSAPRGRLSQCPALACVKHAAIA
jgi:hypothetical protein